MPVITTLDLSPLEGLSVRTARLELRLPGLDELEQLAQSAARHGVHPREQMPFLVPWTDSIREPSFLEEFIAYHAGRRAVWRPDEWELELGVWADGELVGVQAIGGESFGTIRTTSTGSWLTLPNQRRGIGSEMRSAVLHLAFEGLGAVASESGALDGNVASARLSVRLGYEAVGSRVVTVQGKLRREEQYRLTRERWRQFKHAPVEIVGLQDCLELFGV